MKLTKKTLRELIKEELQHTRVLSESAAEVAAQMKILQALIKSGHVTPEEAKIMKADLLQKVSSSPEKTVASGTTRMAANGGDQPVSPGATRMAGNAGGQPVSAGATRMAPGQQGDAAASKKLAVVAKELQVLLAKIQQEL